MRFDASAITTAYQRLSNRERTLVGLANERGGKDNITAVLLEID